VQKRYEKGDARRIKREAQRVKKNKTDQYDEGMEIYTEHFALKGSILDVGGGYGSLRHYIRPAQNLLYVCVDPILKVFENIASNPNLLKAFPSYNQPCNFLACYAENLPFCEKSFDWVHMRSVLDHFYDPYRAMIEAYRVLKDSGKVLIGLKITNGQSILKKDENAEKTTYVSPIVPKVLRLFRSLGLIRAAKYELKTFATKPPGSQHMSYWSYDNLLDLLKTTNFTVIKEYWQKPPSDSCLFISVEKNRLLAESGEIVKEE
jgi:ubiquinone/menaquinone biosynthesis C-methylase UbiE